MKLAVIVFPGSNCDHDMYHAVSKVMGQEVSFVKSSETSLEGFDGVLLPGGFSYGDYLRSGALASKSNIIPAIKKMAEEGKMVMGVCNGFQILCEMGLLPGSLQKNNCLHFVCDTVDLKVNRNTKFTSEYDADIIKLPIAHGEGNYYIDEKGLAELKANNQIVFSYCNNPNGSIEDIAGICNDKGNVLGMMPHPERAMEEILNNTDGIKLFSSIISNFKGDL